MKAYLLLIVTVIVWGSNYIVSSWLVGQFNPMILAAIRILFNTCFLIIFAWSTHRFVRLTRREWGYLFLVGVFGILLNQILFFSALMYTSPTNSALIISLAPIATSILAFIILRERVTVRMILGSLIAVIGVYFLIAYGKHGFSLGLGELLSGGAMLVFAVSTVIVRVLTRTQGSITINLYSTIFGAILFVPLAYAGNHHPVIAHTLWPWLLTAVSAIVSQGLGGLMWYHGMSQVGASKASIFLNFQPFVTMIVGYLALGLPITESQWIGSALIIFGVAFATVQLQAMRRKSLPL